jgi:hypothetical protein
LGVTRTVREAAPVHASAPISNRPSRRICPAHAAGYPCMVNCHVNPLVTDSAPLLARELELQTSIVSHWNSWRTKKKGSKINSSSPPTRYSSLWQLEELSICAVFTRNRVLTNAFPLLSAELPSLQESRLRWSFFRRPSVESRQEGLDDFFRLG